MRSQLIPRTLQATLGAILLFVFTVQSPVFAEVYKCVSVNGGTTYNDSPCDAHENTYRLSKSARKVDSLDCRIARNFAFDTVVRMRQNDSALDVMNVYGGADAMSDDARSLVNQVYTFESDTLISSQKIVDLTVDRCQAGLLGDSLDQCESFPNDFIQHYGSCVNARENQQRGQVQQPQRGDDRAVQNSANPLNGETPTLNAANPVDPVDNTEKSDTMQDVQAP